MGWRIERSRLARDDLLDIWCHIALDDEAAADRMLDRIETKLRRLVDHPHSNRARDDILPGLHGFSVGRYLVLHRLEKSRGVVQIVRVVHAMRDVRSLFA